MLRVALTGGIASGKSAAARYFRDLGVAVIDTDRIAREVVQPGTPGLKALRTALGPDILDESGRLDRARLRQRIFEDDATRERVNAILHPLILARVDGELGQLADTGAQPYAVVEIPLLAESGLAPGFDRVLVIDVPEHIQLERLVQRDDTSPEQARDALAAQASRDERLQLATEVIDNASDLDALHRQVREMHEHYLDLAGQFASSPDRPSE